MAQQLFWIGKKTTDNIVAIIYLNFWLNIIDFMRLISLNFNASLFCPYLIYYRDFLLFKQKQVM